MNDLSSFIEAQRAAGSFESAGSFTLALEKAAEKLGSHSLVNPEDYILKLVQCAVRLQVDQLHIKLLKRSVVLFFETPAGDRTVSIEALSLALAAPLEESDPARSYLALAICAVAGQSPAELMWGEWDEQGGTILSLAEGRSEVFANAPFPRMEPLAPGRRFFLFFMTKPASGLPMSQMSAEHAVLCQRCAFTPMPLVLDGTPLRPTLPVTLATNDPFSEWTSPYLGALEITRHEDGPYLRWPAAPLNKEAWRSNALPDELSEFSPSLPPVYRLRLPKGFTSPMAEAGTFSEIFGIPVYLYGNSWLFYIKDGVSLHPIKVHDAGGGAFAVLDGHHIRTDLTGLQAIWDHTVDLDAKRVTEVWRAQVQLMLASPPPVYENKPVYARGSTMMTLLGCCLLGPLGLLAGPIYAFFQKKTSPQSQARRKLQRQLEVRYSYLTFNRKSQPPEIS